MIPSNLPASYAELLHDKQQRDLREPTDREIERFVDDWMEKELKKQGYMFIFEALSESDGIELFKAYQEDDALEIGIAVKKIVNKYWATIAYKEAEEHDFAES